MDSFIASNPIGQLLAFAQPDAPENELAVHRLVCEVLESGIPTELLNGSLRKIVADDQYFDDGWQHNRIVLGERFGRIVSLSAISKPSRFAYSLDANVWVGSLGSSIVIEEYHLEDSIVNSCGNSQVEHVGSHLLLPNDVCRLFAGNVYRITPERQTLLLSFSLPPTSNTLTKVDCEDRRIVESQHIQNDIMALKSAAEILGEFGDESSFDSLAELVGHTSPHVRWAAATALVQISPARAIDVIRPMLKDPDRQVRAAAKATIDRVAIHLQCNLEVRQ